MYAIVAFVGALTLAQTVSPAALFTAYWIALLVGRVLPRLRMSWRAVQLAALSIGLLVLLAIVRVQVFGSRIDWFDASWLPRYFVSLFSLREGVSGEFLTTVAVVYMFVRGLGSAQRPLTLWFIGFQFRLGIVAFFFVLIAFATAPAARARYDATFWIFLYFFLALLAVALARMDDIGSTIAIGPRWAVTLLAAVTLVILLGVVLLQFFTLDAANWLLVLLSPVFALFGTLLFLLLIPAGMLAEWLLNALEPFLRGFRSALEALQNLVPPEAAQQQPTSQSIPYLEFIGSAMKILFVVAVMLGVGLLLAKALNRRMLQVEEETFVRESVGPDEESGRVHETAHRKAGDRGRRATMTAETIRRIYAALVARASNAGLPRRAAETPYEFLPRLQNAWPNTADDMQAITEAYIAVHYGEHAASAEEVGRVRSAWRRVQGGIKRDA